MYRTKLVLFLAFLPSLLVAEDIVLTPQEEVFYEHFEEVLYGGKPVGPGEIDVSVSIGNCTGTFVSESVLLTAGHCRTTGSSVNFRFKGTSYSGSCTRHPQYSQGTWLNNDITLCKFSPKLISKVYGDLSPMPVKSGDIVTMQGYGAGSNGRLNVGEAVVIRVNDMEAVTRGKVYLGGGDSGGALFLQVKDLVNGPFKIVGVNSRGSGNTSLFNLTSLERSQKFFTDYATKNSVKICGVTGPCGSVPPPPPPPPPPDGDEDDLPPAECLASLYKASILWDEVKHAEIIESKCKSKAVMDSGTLLINGRPALDGEFLDAVRITIGNSGCTATIVGPTTIISAAHCGPSNSNARFTVAGKSYTSTCTRHPDYPRKDLDILVCKTNTEITGVKFASVKGTSAIGDALTIAGYGCVQPGGGGGNDGILRVGNAVVTGFSAFDIISSKGSALCFGDSGGPSYKVMLDNFKEHHYLLGVNSKGNIRDTNYSTNLSLSDSKSFLAFWASANSSKICGIDLICDDASIPPPPPPPPIPPAPGLCAEEIAIADYVRARFKEANEEYKVCLKLN